MDKLKEYFKDWLNSHMFLKDEMEYIAVYELALFFEYCSKREEIEKKNKGYWIELNVNKDATHNVCCSECGAKYKSKGHANSYYTLNKFKFCPSCGIKMERRTDGQ